MRSKTQDDNGMTFFQKMHIQKQKDEKKEAKQRRNGEVLKSNDGSYYSKNENQAYR